MYQMARFIIIIILISSLFKGYMSSSSSSSAASSEYMHPSSMSSASANSNMNQSNKKPTGNHPTSTSPLASSILKPSFPLSALYSTSTTGISNPYPVRTMIGNLMFRLRQHRTQMLLIPSLLRIVYQYRRPLVDGLATAYQSLMASNAEAGGTAAAAAVAGSSPARVGQSDPERIEKLAMNFDNLLHDRPQYLQNSLSYYPLSPMQNVRATFNTETYPHSIDPNSGLTWLYAGRHAYPWIAPALI